MQMGNALPDRKMIVAKINDLKDEVQDIRQLIRKQNEKNHGNCGKPAAAEK